MFDFEFFGFMFDFEFFGIVFNFEFFLVQILNFFREKKNRIFFFFLVLKKTYSCVFETQLYEALAAFLKHSQNYTHSCVLNAAQSGSIAAFFTKPSYKSQPIGG